MTTRLRLLPLLLLPLLLLPGCADGADGGDGGGPGVDVRQTDLSIDLSCGRGFAAVDEAGGVMLQLSHDGSAPLPRTVTFPDPHWEAEVRTGEDLGANWCSDVVLEPEAVVEATWQVTGGTLTFASAPPPATEDGRPADVRASVTGLTIESVDGRVRTMPDVELHNDAWGFFPG